MKIELKPFIKWLGGKRQMLPAIREMTKNLNITNYIEPFAGAASVLFEFQPEHACINDLNSQLITTYNVIKNNCSDLIETLREYDKEIPGDVYYDKRTQYNKMIETSDFSDPVKLAALFIWLNKHCFNGLYRVNKKGLFNASWNKREIPFQSTSFENLQNISNYLKNVNITNLDFAECLNSQLENIGPDTFVFLDPPYEKFGNSTFTSYTASGFETEMGEKTYQYFLKLHDLGAKVMLTNYPNEEFINLFKRTEYSSLFHIHELDVNRMVNNVGSERKSKEVIIYNFRK